MKSNEAQPVQHVLLVSPKNVLDSAEFIHRHAKDVGIHLPSCTSLAHQIVERLRIAGAPTWTAHPLQPREKTARTVNWYRVQSAYWQSFRIFFCDLLNFSFWSDDEVPFQVTFDGATYSSYWAFVACLCKAESQGLAITDPKYILGASEATLATLFVDDYGRPIPMLSDRVSLLKSAALKLQTKFDGTFTKCIEDAGYDATSLLNLTIAEFPSFLDASWSNGRVVTFLKRAQILIADLWLCFEGKDYGRLEGVEELTIFADYRIPQALNRYGILTYSERLHALIESKTLIPSGSEHEIEIRGSSIWAANCITLEIQRIAPELKVTSVVVDYVLWVHARRRMTLFVMSW